MCLLTLKDLDFSQKKVIVRVDFNTPLNDSFQITDDSRITAVLPTIQYLLDQNASIILISHLGRPKGEANPNFSLKVCAQRLSEKLNQPVLMAPDCIGEKTDEMKRALKPKEILMLENVRFHKEETDENRDDAFAKALAKECDLYVNDAFGCSHRSQASVVDLPKLFSNKSAMGFLLEKEIKQFKEYIFNARRPFVAIVGGAKISTKIGVLESLIEKVDTLLIGGAMAYTFLKAQGIDVGKSLVEKDYIDQAKTILQKCQSKNIDLILPLDIVYVKEFKEEADQKVISVGDSVPSDLEGVDIGPNTIASFEKALLDAKTVLWNGPLGVFEIKNFAKGTKATAQILTKINATTVIGGGDSAAAIKQLHLENQFDHISTGGGASLEYIEKGHLPGIDALSKKD